MELGQVLVIILLHHQEEERVHQSGHCQKSGSNGQQQQSTMSSFLNPLSQFDEYKFTNLGDAAGCRNDRRKVGVELFHFEFLMSVGVGAFNFKMWMIKNIFYETRTEVVNITDHYYDAAALSKKHAFCDLRTINLPHYWGDVGRHYL